MPLLFFLFFAKLLEKKNDVMSNCSEFFLDDLTAICAIPVADFNPKRAAWQLTATIGKAEFSPTLTGAIVIGRFPATPAGKLIPIMHNTGKAKDGEGDSVAGRLHTVNVSCEADGRDSAIWDHLLLLERTPCHLLLTFRDGVTKGFVQATADSYLCNTERDGSKTTVTFRIQNLMGIQIIV